MDNLLQGKLAPLRERIDSVDRQILELLNERARLALQVGEVKQDFDAGAPVLKPEREAALVRGLQQSNEGPFTAPGIAAVWREIISTCRGLESSAVVAYLGPQGSFSEQ